VVAILTVASFAELVHWHIGANEQGCVLCHARHEPGIRNPVGVALVIPVVSEQEFDAPKIQPQSRDSAPVHSGRSPPASF
jgi:hypothetical protein